MIKRNFYNIASFIISHILLVQNTEISKNNFLNIWVYIYSKFGMAQALQHLGMELKGTHYRGIDNAHNIAAIYRYMQTNRKG